MRLNRTLCTFVLLLPALTTADFAADHRDAPLIANDPGADLTDVYAFVDPNDAINFVFIANLYPNAPDDAAFPRRGLKFHFDLDGDAWQDRTVTFKFSKLKNNGTQKVKGRFSGAPDSTLNGKLVKGKTTVPGAAPNVIHAKQGISAFAGLSDDPFFADFQFLDRPATCPPANDSFADANILSVVLEVPVEVFVPGATQVPPIGFWVETRRDSLGSPLTNTLLNPPNKLVPFGNPRDKDRFNATPPHEQRGRFFEPVLQTFSALNNPAAARRLADDTFPDILFLDPNQPPGFPNGRRLEDDVVDIALAALTGGIETTDCVPNNDAPFREVFPYLGAPHVLDN